MPLKFWVSKRSQSAFFENNIPAYKCYKSIGFNEIATDCYETETVNGEESKIIELEITKTDYINHNKRK